MTSDFHTSKEECEKALRKNAATNDRYRNFCQKYFTAGDEEQFFQRRDWSNSNSNSDTDAFDAQFDIWDGYAHARADSVTNTFLYLFHKFKKGIYVRVKDNKVLTFLPFSKAKFVNEWGDRMHIDPKYPRFSDFFKHINQMEGRPFNEHRVNKFPDEWYANNCLLRYEFPLSEGDTGTSQVKNMLDELCGQRRIPDLEFFVNRRDFPLLKRDGTEPYDHIYDSDDVPLLSHKYETYAPIFSFVYKEKFADLAIPTIDDWARIKSVEGVFFEKTHQRHYDDCFDIEWAHKKPTAVFRGGSTGCGTRIDTNPRLKVAFLSSLQKSHDGILLLDAGITDWNLRPRKIKGEKYLQTIDIDKLPFQLAEKLSPRQQSGYKYIIHIQGHVAAYRLSLELAMGSTILLVHSEYHLWFFDKLKPFEHYVPVKSDLSDLFEKILWCRNNDEACRQMAVNARQFYSTYLTKDSMFDYLQRLLTATKHKVGSFEYPEKPLPVVFAEKDCEWVKSNFLCTLPIRNQNLLMKLKNTELYSCDEPTLIVKKSNKKELLRDAFVYAKGQLSLVSNFAQIHGVLPDGGVVMQKIEGCTLFDWLQHNYDTSQFVSILLQSALAIYQAQILSGFVHNDLMPWNVMVQNKKKEFQPLVVIFDKQYTLSSTNVFPVIIDYGKSHIIADFKHRGLINPFKMCAIHDLFTLVISSISVLICNSQTRIHLSPPQEQFLIHLTNFFHPSKILPKKLVSFPALRHFISTHSSFSVLTSLDKGMQFKDNLDFVQYLASHATILPRPIFNPTVRNINAPLPPLRFKNKLLVYFFFQRLNSPCFITNFQHYLSITPDVFFEYTIQRPEQLSDECYLNPSLLQKMVQNPAFIDKDLVEEKFLAYKVLSYRGKFQVKDCHKAQFLHVYDSINIFQIYHCIANFNTFVM